MSCIVKLTSMHFSQLKKKLIFSVLYLRFIYGNRKQVSQLFSLHLSSFPPQLELNFIFPLFLIRHVDNLNYEVPFLVEMEIPELVDEEGNFNIGKKSTEALRTVANDFESFLQRSVGVCRTGFNFMWVWGVWCVYSKKSQDNYGLSVWVVFTRGTGLHFFASNFVMSVCMCTGLVWMEVGVCVVPCVSWPHCHHSGLRVLLGRWLMYYSGN